MKFGMVFDNVGWQRAESIAEIFGNIREAANAGVKEWSRVEGVGPTIAKLIVADIRNEH